MRYESFYAALDAETSQTSAGSTTSSGDKTVVAEGIDFALAGSPATEWKIGQLVFCFDLGAGGSLKLFYGRITKRTHGPEHVTIVPIQSRLDSPGVMGITFKSGGLISGAVWTTALTCVVDLTDAPNLPLRFSYVIACSAGLASSSAGSLVSARLQVSRAVADPYGDTTADYFADDIAVAPAATSGVRPVCIGGYSIFLTPGQRYEIKLQFQSGGDYLATISNARIWAQRADTFYLAEQDAEVTRTATTFAAIAGATTGALPAGDYLVIATWLERLNGVTLNANDGMVVEFGTTPSGGSFTALATHNWSPDLVTEYVSSGYVRVLKNVPANATIGLQHKVLSGSQAGATSRVKRAVVMAVPIGSMDIGRTIEKDIGSATNSSLTAKAWNTLVDSDLNQVTNYSITAAFIDVLQYGDVAGQRLRPDWNSALVFDPERRGYTYVDQPAGRHARDVCSFFLNRNMRAVGTSPSRLQMLTGAGVTSAAYRQVVFSGLRLGMEPAYTDDREYVIAADVEAAVGYKKWVAAGTDMWSRTIPDVDMVTRVTVNGIDYTEQATVGDVNAEKEWFWDPTSRMVTIKMSSGGDPADPAITVLLGVPYMVSRDQPAALTDDNGTVRQYEPRLVEVPSIQQTLDIKAEGCEVAQSYGRFTLSGQDGAFTNSLRRRLIDGQRVRVYRGRKNVQTKLRDMERIVSAYLGSPSFDPQSGELTLDVHDTSFAMQRPVSSTLMSIYENTVQRTDFLAPLVIGTHRRIPAYRTTDLTGSANTFKISTLHAFKNIGWINASGTFEAKAFTDGSRAAPDIASITTDLANGAFTIPSSDAAYRNDVVYVDAQGLTADGTAAGALLEMPGEIIANLLTGASRLGLAEERVVLWSLKNLDRVWRLRRTITGVKVPLGIKIGLYLQAETYADAMNQICLTCFAYWAITRSGRIRVAVPDTSAANLVDNSGIEADPVTGTAPLSTWPWRAGWNGSLAVGTDVKYQGSASLQVNQGSPSNLGDARQTIVFPRPGLYAVTCLVSLQTGDGSSVRLSVTQPGDGLKEELSDAVVATSTEWTRLSMVVQVPDGCAGTGIVRVVPYLPQGRQVADPTDNSLILWARADSLAFPDGTVIGDSGAGTQWTDQSGHGNDLTQPIAAARPTLKLNAVAGHPAVFFDDKDDSLTTPVGFDVTTTATIMVVFAYRSLESENRRILSGHAVNWLVGPYQNTLRGYVGSDFVPTSGWEPVTPYAPVVMVLRQNGTATSRLWVNGNGYPNVTTAAQIGAGRLRIGDSPTTPGEVCGNAYVCEVLVFSEALSGVKRSRYEQALMAKYGIAAAAINLDDVNVVPVGLVVHAAGSAGSHARDAVVGPISVSLETYFEARVPYNPNTQARERTNAIVITDSEARNLIASYDPSKSEARGTNPASGRLDLQQYNEALVISDLTTANAIQSALGVGAALASWYGRPRNVMAVTASDFDELPEIGEYLYHESIANIPNSASDFPLWLITTVDDASDPAVTVDIECQSEMDPIEDRAEIAPNDVPLGGIIVVATGAACPDDYDEVPTQSGFYVQGAQFGDQVNVYGGSHHVHDLTQHFHALPSHTHPGTGPASLDPGGIVTTPYVYDGTWTTYYEERAHFQTVGPGETKLAARGPGSGGHYQYCTGAGTFTFGSQGGGYSGLPTTTVTSWNGPNDIKNKRVIFCRRVRQDNPIPAVACFPYAQAAAPTNWKRCDGTNSTQDLQDYALRGADIGNTGVVTRAIASHTQTTAGAWVTPTSGGIANLNLYARVTIADGAKTYRGRITQIDSVGVGSGPRVFVVPSHETGDYVDGTVYNGTPTISCDSEDVGATFSPSTHLHVRGNVAGAGPTDGTGAIPEHLHPASHRHLATTAIEYDNGEGAYPVVTDQRRGSTSNPPDGVPLALHTHAMQPQTPLESGTGQAQSAPNRGGSITGAGQNVPSTIRLPFIQATSGTETATPVGLMIFSDGTKCWPGWIELTAARGRIIVGASNGEGVILIDGGHGHACTYAAHPFSHAHGVTYTDVSFPAQEVYDPDGAPRESGEFMVFGPHGHAGTVTVTATDPTLSAASGSTGLTLGSTTQPPSKRLLLCQKT